MIEVRNRYWIWAGPVVLISLLLDQISKAIVLNTDVFNARECLFQDARICGQIDLSQSFDLSMVWNYGMSYGLFQTDGIGRWVLFLITLVISFAFLAWMLKAERARTALALALVIGGALGNMIDRARFGAVVDFFDFSGPWFGISFPAESGVFAWIDKSLYHPDGMLGLGFPYVFNVADMAITFGAIILFADQVLADREKTG